MAIRPCCLLAGLFAKANCLHAPTFSLEAHGSVMIRRFREFTFTRPRIVDLLAPLKPRKTTKVKVWGNLDSIRLRCKSSHCPINCDAFYTFHPCLDELKAGPRTRPLRSYSAAHSLLPLLETSPVRSLVISCRFTDHAYCEAFNFSPGWSNSFN